VMLDRVVGVTAHMPGRLDIIESFGKTPRQP